MISGGKSYAAYNNVFNTAVTYINGGQAYTDYMLFIDKRSKIAAAGLAPAKIATLPTILRAVNFKPKNGALYVEKSAELPAVSAADGKTVECVGFGNSTGSMIFNQSLLCADNKEKGVLKELGKPIKVVGKFFINLIESGGARVLKDGEELGKILLGYSLASSCTFSLALSDMPCDNPYAERTDARIIEKRGMSKVGSVLDYTASGFAAGTEFSELIFYINDRPAMRIGCDKENAKTVTALPAAGKKSVTLTAPHITRVNSVNGAGVDAGDYQIRASGVYETVKVPYAAGDLKAAAYSKARKLAVLIDGRETRLFTDVFKEVNIPCAADASASAGAGIKILRADGDYLYASRGGDTLSRYLISEDAVEAAGEIKFSDNIADFAVFGNTLRVAVRVGKKYTLHTRTLTPDLRYTTEETEEGASSYDFYGRAGLPAPPGNIIARDADGKYALSFHSGKYRLYYINPFDSELCEIELFNFPDNIKVLSAFFTDKAVILRADKGYYVSFLKNDTAVYKLTEREIAEGNPLQVSVSGNFYVMPSASTAINAAASVAAVYK